MRKDVVYWDRNSENIGSMLVAFYQFLYSASGPQFTKMVEICLGSQYIALQDSSICINDHCITVEGSFWYTNLNLSWWSPHHCRGLFHLSWWSLHDCEGLLLVPKPKLQRSLLYWEVQHVTSNLKCFTEKQQILPGRREPGGLMEYKKPRYHPGKFDIMKPLYTVVMPTGPKTEPWHSSVCRPDMQLPSKPQGFF